MVAEQSVHMPVKTLRFDRRSPWSTSCRSLLPVVLALTLGCGSTTRESVQPIGQDALLDVSAWDSVLIRHVDTLGLVDFAAAGRDTMFRQFVQRLDGATPSEMATREEQLAFWINTYNALTFKLIAESLPIASITDIAGGLTGVIIPGAKSPWDLELATIEGDHMTLQEIEDEYIRALGDERVYFAINRASVGCPRLRRRAFTAANLNQLLDEGLREFLADRSRNYIQNGRLYLSKIFERYRGEFENAGETLQGYIARYWPCAAEAAVIAKLPESAIEFLDHDWRLVTRRRTR